MESQESENQDSQTKTIFVPMFLLTMAIFLTIIVFLETIGVTKVELSALLLICSGYILQHYFLLNITNKKAIKSDSKVNSSQSPS